MDADMKESLIRIKEMVEEHSTGLMVENMMVNGKRVKSMVLEHILIPNKKPKKADGLMDKELNGWKIKILNK